MRFYTIILAALMSMFIDAVMGAGCFSDKAQGKCLTKARLDTAISTYCKNNWRQTTTNWRPWKGANGAEGHIGHIGVFKTQAACVTLAKSIVSKCYTGSNGGQKGGAAEVDQAAINIVWCPWRS